jgi:quinol monooxygenase YgiN
MAHMGKVQLLITFVAPPAKVQEVDKLVASHAAWMRETHPRDGANALLSYNFAKGPELSNALDPSSAPTGNTRYVLTEIYESKNGIQEHWAQSQKSWSDFAAMVQLISSCNPQTLHSGAIVQSLW